MTANQLKIRIAQIALSTNAANPFIKRAEQIQFINQCDRAALLTARVDRLTRKHSAFDGIADLVTAPRYRPTLYTNAAKRVQDRVELKLIADYYDGYMLAAGDSRRAYRV